MPHAASPRERLLTLADWRDAAIADLATPGALAARLGELLAALERGRAESAAWLHLAAPHQLAASARAAEVRAAATADAAALRAALPLYGVPFAVKDNIDVAGWPTTAACPAFAHAAAESAAVVTRLEAAGAVCIGKTNLDQFATGLVGTRSPYGRPASVFSAAHVSGGSSSGSAVVVASGQLPFALGTDTAGSGRIPAGFNHIVGLKPTPGRASTRGVLPACRTLDCVSVLALTVADAAEVLAAIEGPDALDAYSHFAPGPAQWGRERLRVGVPMAPSFGPSPGHTPGYAAAWQAAVAHIESLGHAAVPIDFAPLHAVAALLYDGPWVAERNAVVQGLLERDPAAFDPTVRAVIAAATRHSATDAFRGQYRLREAQRRTAALWEAVDVLMVPTAPAHPTFAEVDADPVGATAQLGTYTNFVNLLGWCALALPFGFAGAAPGGGAGALPATAAAGAGAGAEASLPFGVTFIAAANHDAALARFGLAWQASLALSLGATGAPARAAAPLTWPAVAATLPIAVCGAHLSGLPLHPQLTERGAVLIAATRTAPHYRLHALPGSLPPKPGMQRVAAGGAAIEVEVYAVPLGAVGSFLALVRAPLGLGSIELADGRWVHGFVCEAQALAHAPDVTAFGGWRAYLHSLGDAAPPRGAG